MTDAFSKRQLKILLENPWSYLLLVAEFSRKTKFNQRKVDPKPVNRGENGEKTFGKLVFLPTTKRKQRKTHLTKQTEQAARRWTSGPACCHQSNMGLVNYYYSSRDGS